MIHRAIIPLSTLLCLASINACTTDVVASEEAANSSQAVTSCPNWSNDGQAFAAATIAFNLMKQAALLGCRRHARKNASRSALMT